MCQLIPNVHTQTYTQLRSFPQKAFIIYIFRQILSTIDRNEKKESYNCVTKKLSISYLKLKYLTKWKANRHDPGAVLAKVGVRVLVWRNHFFFLLPFGSHRIYFNHDGDTLGPLGRHGSSITTANLDQDDPYAQTGRIATNSW